MEVVRKKSAFSTTTTKKKMTRKKPIQVRRKIEAAKGQKLDGF